jgi:hypothetical protein
MGVPTRSRAPVAQVRRRDALESSCEMLCDVQYTIKPHYRFDPSLRAMAGHTGRPGGIERYDE